MSSPYFNKIQAFNYTSSNSSTISYVNSTQTSLHRTGGYNNMWIGLAYNDTHRINMNFGTTFQVYSSTYSYFNHNGSNSTSYFYGSNSASNYTDLSNTTPSSTLLGSYLNSGSGVVATIIVTNTSLFQYIHIIGVCNNISAPATGFTYLKVNHVAGGYSGFINGTDSTIATDSTSGAPSITYTDSTTSNLLYNENNLSLSEAYRRLYPVVRDKNTIKLTD